MKLLVLCVVALLIGVAAGIGVGMTMTKPKLEEKQTQIADLETKFSNLQDEKEKLEKSKADSDMAVQRASQQIIQLKRNYKAVLDQLNDKLTKANAELVRLRNPEPVEVVTTEMVTEQAKPQPAAAAETSNMSTNTKEYIVQDGDNLWMIAEKQLDNGARYQEIIKLNPGVTDKTILKKGMKLKLPTQ